MSAILLIIYFILLIIFSFIMGIGLYKFFLHRFADDQAHFVTFGFILLFILVVSISLLLISKESWSFKMPEFFN